ncbi:hypothetical protein [Huintestinicola sp.]|uniref:hypothetical protein n=1 Tax=Huintestinicola sp. TaxID=2981661 RepID=UPI003D7CC2E2
MNKSEKEKGSALSTVIIIILLILIAIAVFLFLKGSFGFGNGSGNGNSEAAVPANAEAVTEADSEPSATTTIQTEETKYFEITVSGNSYNFQNKTYESIDELMNVIDSTGDKLDAKITNEEASKNAYDNLIDALKENGFAIIEEN